MSSNNSYLIILTNSDILEKVIVNILIMQILGTNECLKHWMSCTSDTAPPLLHRLHTVHFQPNHTAGLPHQLVECHRPSKQQEPVAHRRMALAWTQEARQDGAEMMDPDISEHKPIQKIGSKQMTGLVLWRQTCCSLHLPFCPTESSCSCFCHF